jgi:hypothetical protein
MQILWATNRHYEIDWEYSWIKELLGDIKYNIRNLTRMDDIVSDALIVFNHNIPYYQYLLQYENMRIPFGIIHLSDEYINDPIDIYNFKMCKFVFRNCYKPSLKDNTKVIQFPLGYKYGFWENYEGESPKNIKERKYNWNFAGGMRKNREEILDLFIQEISNNKVVIEIGNSFNEVKSGLSTKNYRELMMNSKFTLSPTGNVSVDCFRLYEALECGSIPITIARTKIQELYPSYWHIMFEEEPPFIIGETWDDALNKVKELLKNKEEYEKCRIKCYEFWINYKNKLKQTLKNEIFKLECS